jgi:hypothetical protein
MKKEKDESVNKSMNTSVFEKNSFQQFSKNSKVFKAENEIGGMIKDLSKALKKKIKIKEQ